MKKHLGFTLVEFMVAITVGLILTAIIAQVFVGTKQTFRTQDDLSRIQEEGRYAVELISRSLRLAGYRANYNVAYNDAAGGFPAGTEHIGGTASPNTLTVRYFGSGPAGNPDNTIRNCTGIGVDSVTRQTDTFSVAGNKLLCSGSELINNVTDLQVRYGEDTDADLNKTPNKYIAANAAPAPVWDNVTAVRICIELQSANNNITTVNQQYTDCSGTAKTATDRRYHRIFTTTVALRNKLN